MKIEVELFMNLKEISPERYGNGPVELEIPGEATLGDLIRSLGIPASQPLIALVDGRTADSSCSLREGQLVTLFPPLDGG